MSRTDRSLELFDEDEVRGTREFLPRLLRIFFYSLGITYEGYTARHWEFWKKTSQNEKAFGIKNSSNRKTIKENQDVITFKMFKANVEAMGFQLEEVSVRVRDNLTGEIHHFSTDTTVDEIKAKRAQKTDGITSL